MKIYESALINFVILINCIFFVPFISTENVVPNVPNVPQEFVYSQGKNGPQGWGSRYDVCAGKRQSPIDVHSEFVVASMPRLRFDGLWDLRKDGLVLANTCWNSVEVRYTGDAPRLKGGPLRSDYVLASAHFHWGSDTGSEHSLDKLYYGMEAHFVHYKKEYGTVQNASKEHDGLAVVALLLSATQKSNVGLTMLVASLPAVRAGGAATSVPEDAMFWTRKHLGEDGFYTYQGSLTTPPCNEIVTWIVMDSVATIGIKQIREFQKVKGQNNVIIAENRRPVQPLYGRQIFYSAGKANHFDKKNLNYFLILLLINIM